jgi:hypothetical protein
MLLFNFPTYLLGVGFGTALHLNYFRYGDWNRYTSRLLFSFVALHSGIAIVYAKLLETTYFTKASYTASTWIVSSIIVGIFTSMLVYRAAFHQLNGFPGPFAARLTNFYITAKSVKKFHLYEEIQKLHDQYGDFVRVGMFPICCLIIGEI